MSTVHACGDAHPLWCRNSKKHTVVFLTAPAHAARSSPFRLAQDSSSAMGRLEAPGAELHAWLRSNSVGSLLAPYSSQLGLVSRADGGGEGVVAEQDLKADEGLEAACM